MNRIILFLFSKKYFSNWLKIQKQKIQLKREKQEIQLHSLRADFLALTNKKEYHVVKSNGIYEVVDNTVVNIYNEKIKDAIIFGIHANQFR